MKKLTLVAILTLFTGCSYYLPSAVSSSAIGPKEKPLRIATGTSQSFYFLFFGPFGDDSSKAALENAVQEDGDTLMNVFVDRQITFFPFPHFSIFSIVRTSITGTLVRYTDESGFLEKKKVAETVMNTPDEIRKGIASLKWNTPIRIYFKDGAVRNYRFNHCDGSIITTVDGKTFDIKDISYVVLPQN